MERMGRPICWGADGLHYFASIVFESFMDDYDSYFFSITSLFNLSSWFQYENFIVRSVRYM
jgi:hypothetical protein